MIYVPDKENYSCFVVRDSNTIRAYKQKPTYNSNIDYRDYYVNSNYMYQDGNQQFSNYSTLPVCLNNSELTNNVYYRNDFDSILIIFLILSIFCFLIPLKVFLRFFRRLQ